jgi:queuine tRNA-ribosyltransferase
MAGHQWLFGIVQGGDSQPLRVASARATRDLGFDGFAHGGLGLGEADALRGELVSAAHAELPEAAPRYLMGLGRPWDLLEGIALGVDLFDCVLPTRHARHGVLFTHSGLLRLRNARYRGDPLPPDPDCDCATCARFSRAYLRHLLHAGEALGARLASLHNLRFYLSLMERAREAIRAGRFAALRERLGVLRDASSG